MSDIGEVSDIDEVCDCNQKTTEEIVEMLRCDLKEYKKNHFSKVLSFDSLIDDLERSNNPVQEIVSRFDCGEKKILLNTCYGGFRVHELVGMMIALLIDDVDLDNDLSHLIRENFYYQTIFAFERYKTISCEEKCEIRSAFYEKFGGKKLSFTCDSRYETYVEIIVVPFDVPYKISEYDGLESITLDFHQLFSKLVFRLSEADISAERCRESIIALKELLSKICNKYKSEFRCKFLE